ncbi:MAG TPA: hypothetical protein VHM24_10655 [Gemmatimonadaceae bacterium]|nr:hypothetical protein [Gemmatimonadaceae bacterium]
MIGQPPPFALSTPEFRFRALASHAGRAALGGDREVAFACFATARLAAAMLPPFSIPPAEAAARSASTRHWLASLAVPAAARAALNAAIDAIAGGNRSAASSALTELTDVASAQLDGASVAELKELASELSGTQGQEPGREPSASGF